MIDLREFETLETWPTRQRPSDLPDFFKRADFAPRICSRGRNLARGRSFISMKMGPNDTIPSHSYPYFLYVQFPACSFAPCLSKHFAEEWTGCLGQGCPRGLHESSLVRRLDLGFSSLSDASCPFFHEKLPPSRD